MIENVKRDIPVVLYGAGITAGYVHDKFIKNGITPVCFADSNKNKQHRPAFRGCNLPTYSIDEVKALFPKYQIYVTTFSSVRFEIFNYLITECGVDKENIINFAPYIKRLSCKRLENLCRCTHYHVVFCCAPREKTKVPVIWYEEAGGYSAAIDEFLRLREETVESLQNGTAKYCQGCSYLKEMYCAEKYYISDLANGGSDIPYCNLKCVYCHGAKRQYLDMKPKVSKYFQEVVKELESRELISPEHTTLTMGDGEVAIMPFRNELYALAEKYNSQIFTNASVYSEEIANLLSEHSTRINVSVDCGTKESFLKIKGVDAFETVKQNLIMYGKTGGNIILKYIFLPSINDNDEDFKGFIQLCKDAGVFHVRLSYDYTQDYSVLKERLMEKILRFTDMLRKESFVVDAAEMTIFAKSDYDAIVGNI